MKKSLILVVGIIIGAAFSIGAPALAAQLNLQDVYNKTKTALRETKDVKSKVNTVNSSVNDVEDSLSYLQSLTENIYDGSYYQSSLQNNIAYNAVITCISAGGGSYCESPDYIDASIYDYDVSVFGGQQLLVLRQEVEQSANVVDQYKSSEDRLRASQ